MRKLDTTMIRSCNSLKLQDFDSYQTKNTYLTTSNNNNLTILKLRFLLHILFYH